MQIQFQNLFFPPLPLLAAIQVNKNEKALQPLMYCVTCPRRVTEYQLTRWCCLSLFGRDGGEGLASTFWTGAATHAHEFLQQPLDLHILSSRLLPEKKLEFLPRLYRKINTASKQ